MKNSKDALREKIKKHFKDYHPEYTPKFYIQGSYKMKNGIRYKDDTADLDDGIYFDTEPDVTPATLQKWVCDAVDRHTEGGHQHKKKCIRVIYAGDYNIDLPVFYQTEDDDHPWLAVKNEDWKADDPGALVDWFNDEKDDEGQLIRITKYLKAWGDHKRHNMPSGLCMTILAANNIAYNSREDECLLSTLKNIQNDLNGRWECVMPTTPHEDLFDEYDNTFKKNFKQGLSNFIEDAQTALDTDDEEKASKLWRKHLGDRFPLSENDDDKKNNTKSASALSGVASRSKPWCSMSTNNKQLQNDIRAVLRVFPEFEEIPLEDYKLRLEGPLEIIDLEGQYRGCFEVQITINTVNYPHCFPDMKEISNKIPRIADRHVYEDTGTCCVTILQKQIIEACKGISLSRYIKHYAIPYLANQIYFEENDGKWANGDYLHGTPGILQYYYELFDTEDIELILTGMSRAMEPDHYDRNVVCFCGNKKYKNCHKAAVDEIRWLGKRVLLAHSGLLKTEAMQKAIKSLMKSVEE